MFKWLTSLFKDDTPAEMEHLIDLIAVARQDEDIYQRLYALLNQPRTQRLDAIEVWLVHCEKQHAPESFVDALAKLKDDDVAKVALASLLMKT